MKKLLKRIDDILDQIDSLSRLVQTCLARSQPRILYPVIVTITGENGNSNNCPAGPAVPDRPNYLADTFWLAPNECKQVVFETFISFKEGAKVSVVGGYIKDIKLGCISYVNSQPNCAITNITLIDPFPVDKRLILDIWIPGIKTE